DRPVPDFLAREKTPPDNRRGSCSKRPCPRRSRRTPSVRLGPRRARVAAQFLGNTVDHVRQLRVRYRRGTQEFEKVSPGGIGEPPDSGEKAGIDRMQNANPRKEVRFVAQFTVDHPESNLRSEEHTSELQSRENLVCRLL